MSTDAAARNARRRARYAERRREARLSELHRLEADGQLSLDPTPLPPLPVKATR